VPLGGFCQTIGPLWWRLDKGQVRFAFRAGPEHLNPQGIVHGGMLASFADHVMGAAVWEAIGRKPCATVSLHSSFLGPARAGEWVEGLAKVTRRGQSLVFVVGRLFAGDRGLLTAEGIWKVLKPSKAVAPPL
jgi:uncharacterized protein (TIGR00369 family)